MNTVENLMSELELEKLKNKRLLKKLDNAYNIPKQIPLWKCIKHKLWGYTDDIAYMGLLGVGYVYKKIQLLLYYKTICYKFPKWFLIESIELEDFVDDNPYGLKYKRIVLKGKHHIYMLYYKFNNLLNPHIYENYKYGLKFSIVKNKHYGTY